MFEQPHCVLRQTISSRMPRKSPDYNAMNEGQKQRGKKKGKGVKAKG
jgi:hypothetical protein